MFNRSISKSLKSCMLFLIMGLALSPFIGIARAADDAAPAEDKPTATITTDFLNQYIFRGIALSRDSLVIQPSFTATYKGFSVNVWGNLDTNQASELHPNPGKASWNETDLTLSYTHTICGDLSGTAGYVYYGTQDFTQTMEGFMGLSYALPWDITVGVLAYREFWHAPGWWVELDVSKNFKLPWYGMNIDTGLSLGYLDRSFTDFSNLEAGQLSAALNIPVGKYFTVSPKIGVAFPLSDAGSKDIIANSVDGNDTHVIGGIRIGAAF